MVDCINLCTQNWSADTAASIGNRQKFGVADFVFFTSVRPFGIDSKFFSQILYNLAKIFDSFLVQIFWKLLVNFFVNQFQMVWNVLK